MEYIKSAEDENGTLMIEYFCDTFLIGRKLKNSFSVSRDGNSSGIIKELPRISVSSSSEYKKEACDLIKTFLSGDFLGCLPGIRDLPFCISTKCCPRNLCSCNNHGSRSKRIHEKASGSYMPSVSLLSRQNGIMDIPCRCSGRPDDKK